MGNGDHMGALYCVIIVPHNRILIYGWEDNCCTNSSIPYSYPIFILWRYHNTFCYRFYLYVAFYYCSINYHGWSSTQPGTCAQPCPIVDTAVPPIVHTAVSRENNEHGCVYLRCKAVCKLPGYVEGHPWLCQQFGYQTTAQITLITTHLSCRF